ncbi:hypothetical protein PPR50_004092 [Salmonella enterica]|nr:hypothetical protein [Salmonella enterica]
MRYFPPHCRHFFMLTSPGEVCDHWVLLLLSASGLRLKCRHRMPVLDKNRYTLEGLANELAGISVMPGRRP